MSVRITIGVRKSYKMKLRLRIEGMPQSPYEIEDDFMVSEFYIHMLTGGKVLPVKVDKNDHTKVALNLDEGTTNDDKFKNIADFSIEAYVEILEFANTSKKEGNKDLYSIKMRVSPQGTTEDYVLEKELPFFPYEAANFRVGNTYPCKINKNDKTQLVIITG